MIENILFDLDGTLLNTLNDLADSVNHALSAHHFPTRPTADIRRALGYGAHQLIKQSLPSNVTEEQVDATLATFRSHYLIHQSDTTAPYPGIIHMLRQLHEEGFQTAIVSNKPDDAVQLLHRHFFQGLVNMAQGQTPSIRRKPAADMITACMNRLHASASSTIYVGDSEVDYQTARNAGIRCCLVTWGFRDKEQLTALHPDRLCETPENIIDFIHQQNHSTR